MGIIDFLKKIIEKEIEEPKQEKIDFNNLENWFENKINEINKKEKQVLETINNKILITTKELNEKVKVLENIDIDSKKEHDKLKSIVKETLKDYINYIKKFIENLNNLKQENLEELKNKINEIFSDFHKKTHISYQKATILIGKEMSDTKECIGNFSRDMTNIFDENKNIVETSKVLSSIKLKLKQINKFNENIKDINDKNIVLDKKLNDFKENEKKILENIEEIKKTDSYIENLKKQEEINTIKKQLEKDIYDLKELIDFKALANFFHTYKKEMDIIKDYKENFQIAFNKDNGKGILNLLDESKLNNEKITDKIKQINDKKQLTKTEFKDETKDSLNKIQKIKKEINNLNEEKNKEIKKLEKIKTNKQEINDLIKSELNKINIEINPV